MTHRTVPRGSPRWKVHDENGQYVAACKLVEDAAAVLGGHLPGSCIRDGWAKNRVVWREGEDADGYASDSYDEVAETVERRAREIRAEIRQADEKRKGKR